MPRTGRPTKYKPEFCDRIVEMGKYGASKHEMAMELDISIDTFMEWQKENKDFSAAVKEAMQYSQAWWEQQGRIATFGGVQGFNPTSYIFNMKNRFKEDWRDKHETELTGKDGGAIKLETNDQEIINRFLQKGAKNAIQSGNTEN
jgi:transposase